ncbi:MAG: acyl-CoA reductase, partial [Bacteroidales bacterium]|nr:acyl-CoA reductase [Bacteroidales bacterium]
MNLEQRITAFAELGEILSDAAGKNPVSTDSIKLRTIMENQYQLNRWFTPENVVRSVESLGSMLRMDKIEKWLAGYSIADKHNSNKNIGVIMAGNIPLVGFHDFLSVLISGNRIIGKASSKDNQLIKEVARILTGIDPRFKELIDLTGTYPDYADAVIATGSDNTSRYFEYHYGTKPHIIRKNRNSVAIIDNDTTIEEIRDLGPDIFSYFGLGCRNVSKIYLPAGFNLSILSDAWQDYSTIISHPPYNNNYKYNNALYKLNKTRIND